MFKIIFVHATTAVRASPGMSAEAVRFVEATNKIDVNEHFT